MPDTFEIGDVITITGVYADGTRAPNDGPIDPTKPEKRWRVKALNGREVVLQPLLLDGSVDAFNDAAGDYRIVLRTSETTDAPDDHG